MKQALPHSPAEGPCGTSGELAGLPSFACPKVALPSSPPVALPPAQGQGLTTQKTGSR